MMTRRAKGKTDSALKNAERGGHPFDILFDPMTTAVFLQTLSVPVTIQQVLFGCRDFAVVCQCVGFRCVMCKSRPSFWTRPSSFGKRLLNYPTNHPGNSNTELEIASCFLVPFMKQHICVLLVKNNYQIIYK